MDDLQSSEESAFVGEEVDRIIHQSIEHYLKEKTYDEKLVPHWIDAICETCMKGLSDLNKPFKYVGTENYNRNSDLPYVFTQ